MKKTIFLSFLLLLSIIAKGHDIEVDGIYYLINGNEATVSFEGDVYDYETHEHYYTGDIVIPETITYEGITYRVTSIGYMAFYLCGVNSVVLPNSIVTIDSRAFHDCYSLKSINIPRSVKTIGADAFYGCYSLPSIEIPNSVTSIGSAAFWDCEQFTSFYIPYSVKAIANSTFNGCKRLNKIFIPNSVTSIGNQAFGGCYNLRSIEIPNSITTIGYLAFMGCSGLKDVHIGYSVTSIGSSTFENSVNNIYCYAATPPTINENTFKTYNATLHVPASSLAAYFTAPYWSNFWNIIGDAVAPLGLSINKNSEELQLGEQIKLSATVSPTNASNKIVMWKSSDESIATVDDNGLVTAIGSGECDIIASCFGIPAICHIEVNNLMVNIELDLQEAMLLPNHILTLTPSATPILPEIVVTSSNPEVAAARIMNGIIQVVGIKEGTTTITVGSADGTAIPATCEVTVYTERGDVNCDGYVNISDVTSLIDYLLSGNQDGIKIDNADTYHDGKVNISDVTTLIDYLLSGRWSNDEPVIPGDNHEYVDLGLPSGTLWATMNIGANSPEEHGDYFAWGETAPKEVYDWSTYKWCNGTNNTLTKYCTQSDYGYNGFTDGKTELDFEDDAAYVNWGILWRMPSLEQLQELLEECDWQWTQRNGVNGRLVTGPNGNSIFLPAAGNRYNDSLYHEGSYGDLWSRTHRSLLYNAYYFYFGSGNVNWDYIDRFRGFTVRAVREP